MLDSFLNRARLTPNLAFYAGIFVIFLVTGMWGGHLFGSCGSNLSQPSISSGSPKAVQMSSNIPTSDQHNLLVIGIDQRNSAQPVLESVWLVMYFPGKPDFTFVPVYPMSGGQNVAASSSLLASFSLDSTGRPDQAFLRQLAERIWWNNYLVIDQTGMMAVIDMVGGIPINQHFLDGAQIMKRMPTSSHDPDGGYASQLSLLRALCSQASSSPSKEAIATTLRTIKNNLTTDLDLIDSLDFWFGQNETPITVGCEFPLSSISIP